MILKFKKILTVITTLFIALFLFISMTNKSSHKITEKEAIELAENFIKINGYTTFPADTAKLSYESLDIYEENKDNLLSRRHNSLYPKAFCIKKSGLKYTVGFLRTSVDRTHLDSLQRQTNLSGRVVIIDFQGKKVRMAHQEALFSFFKKL
jgi:hypothetical protein